MAFESSIAVLDKIIRDLETSLGEPPSNVDPDDVWAERGLIKSKLVYKVTCPTPNCGNRLTRPFEQRCPMCFFKDKSSIAAAFEVRPIPDFKTLHTAGNGPKASAPAAASAPKSSSRPAQQAASALPDASDQDPFALFDKCHLQISHVDNVEKHPKSDNLYICKVHVSPSEQRQVVAGLARFLTMDELNGKDIVTITNLKPAKLAGVESQAMILGAEHVDGEVHVVRTLVPPPGAQLGDRVVVEGRTPDGPPPTRQIGKSHWDKVVPLLKVIDGGKASFNGVALVVAGGHDPVSVAGVADGAGIR